ncbi:MAG: hypothetical protein WC637_21535 [Victivallales bacterium]|jgi:hypothetical protein
MSLAWERQASAWLLLRADQTVSDPGIPAPRQGHFSQREKLKFFPAVTRRMIPKVFEYQNMGKNPKNMPCGINYKQILNSLVVKPARAVLLFWIFIWISLSKLARCQDVYDNNLSAGMTMVEIP